MQSRIPGAERSTLHKACGEDGLSCMHVAYPSQLPYSFNVFVYMNVHTVTNVCVLHMGKIVPAEVSNTKRCREGVGGGGRGGEGLEQHVS